jgi:hypothetical protein
MNMRFVTLLSIGALALGATAGPTRVKREVFLVQRDLDTITSVFSNIGDILGKLNTDVTAFDGKAQSIAAIQTDSDDVLKAIKSGTSSIQSTDPLSTTDAVQLQPIVKKLQGQIDTTIKNLVAKKSDLVSAGVGQIVEQTLIDQQTASEELSNTVVSKVPKSLQSIAKSLSSGISDSLQKGIDAFKDVPAGPPGEENPPPPEGSSTPTPTPPPEGSSTPTPTKSSAPGGGESPPKGSSTPPPTTSGYPNPSCAPPPTICGQNATFTMYPPAPPPSGGASCYGISGAAGAFAIIVAAM